MTCMMFWSCGSFQDLIQAEQAPIPPAYAFTGEVKRAEWYNTVSPGFLERTVVKQQLGGGMQQTAQRLRWFAPLPARFGDNLSAMAPLPDLTEGNVDDQSIHCTHAAGALSGLS